MKRVTAIVCMLFVIGMLSVASAFDGNGPAPNSGDCNPDGSGFEEPNEPNSPGPGGSDFGSNGPAPSSGDGVSDGSGFDSPFGPNM